MSEPIQTGAAFAIAFACIELVKSIVLRVLAKNENGKANNGSARVLLEVSQARQLQKIADCSEKIMLKTEDIEDKFESVQLNLALGLDRIGKRIDSVIICPLTSEEMDKLIGRLKGNK